MFLDCGLLLWFGAPKDVIIIEVYYYGLMLLKLFLDCGLLLWFDAPKDVS